jgi:hypothetical protein
MHDFAEEVERLRRKMMAEIEEKRRADELARHQAEVARIKAEQEAEAARIAAEKALWESDDETAAKKAAEAEKAEAARKQTEEARAAAADTVKVVAFVPAKVEGVKFTADFEVFDIDALYHYSPALVTMEAKRKDILDLIKQLGADEDRQIIPGIRITKKTVVSTR